MRTSILALLVAICLAIPSVAISGDNVPNLKGTWKGTSYGIKYGKDKLHWHRPSDAGKVTPVDFTLTIDFQKGRVFSGTKASARDKERLLGVICADNKTIGIVDEDSYHFGKLLAPDKLEIVYMEARPPAQGVSHAIYTRKK